MWSPTEADAIDIFARQFEARHRSGSLGRAQDAALRARDKGDLHGHAVWNRVAEAVERLRNSERTVVRRQREAAKL